MSAAPERPATQGGVVPYDAVILAGGRAERLGGLDKPGALVGGRSLIERVASAVGEATRLIVVGPPRDLTQEPMRAPSEAQPGEGPVRQPLPARKPPRSPGPSSPARIRLEAVLSPRCARGSRRYAHDGWHCSPPTCPSWPLTTSRPCSWPPARGRAPLRREPYSSTTTAGSSGSPASISRPPRTGARRGSTATRWTTSVPHASGHAVPGNRETLYLERRNSYDGQSRSRSAHERA